MKPENYPQNPKALWDLFYDFTQTPRPSKFEDEIRDYLVNLAKNNDKTYQVDQAGNVIIYVDGTGGRENDEPVIIQNHIDMVTDAIPNKKINFKEDPIITVVDGDWLTADGTTLGADNGIGCVAALATIFEPDLIHPPLELLFTTDEETGLNGALGLETQYLKGKKMINLDTEEWGSLYIGCAGGIDYDFFKTLDLVDANKQWNRVKVNISGLVGGHSGCDIHEQRGNAIKLLVQALSELAKTTSFQLETINAGRAHNIIPRDAFATIRIEEDAQLELRKTLGALEKEWLGFLPESDHNLKAEIEILPGGADKVLSETEKKKMLGLLTLFPNGAHSFDLHSKREVVSMSNNLAKVLILNGELYILSSLRFFDRGEVKRIENELDALGEIFGAKVSKNSEYPSWKPVRNNAILDTVKETYKELFGTEAKVTAIHAGLECGIIRDKIGPIDVVSFGPTITGAHSPDERVHIDSVEKFWDLFKAVLAKV